MSNPCKTPKSEPAKAKEKNAPFLTRRRVFWIGVGTIFASVATAMFGYAIRLNSIENDEVGQTTVFMFDIFVAVAYVAGLTTLVVYHWFPDPGRKFRGGVRSKRLILQNSTFLLLHQLRVGPFHFGPKKLGWTRCRNGIFGINCIVRMI